MLVIEKPGGHRDLQSLVEVMREQRITILQLVPSMLHMLLEEDRFVECQDLRRVYCGGEALTRDLAHRFFETFDRRCSGTVYDLYGPTEAAT